MILECVSEGVSRQDEHLSKVVVLPIIKSIEGLERTKGKGQRNSFLFLLA